MIVKITKRYLYGGEIIYEKECTRGCHNPHGPAFRTPDGCNYWLHDAVHNIVGPAWGRSGRKAYYIKGVKISCRIVLI